MNAVAWVAVALAAVVIAVKGALLMIKRAQFNSLAEARASVMQHMPDEVLAAAAQIEYTMQQIEDGERISTQEMALWWQALYARYGTQVVEAANQVVRDRLTD